MPPKKIFKSSHPQPSSSSSKPEEIEHSKLYFDLLPNEILEYIVEFLTPKDIYELLKVCSPRCMKVIYSLKTALYNKCRRVEQEHVLGLFISARVKNIVKINFNNVCHVSAPVLMSAIVKCKNLTTLSVINCGISSSNVITIFQQCQQIENFSWDCHVIQKYNPRDYNSAVSAPKLKNLYMLINHIPRGVQVNDVLQFMKTLFTLGPSDVNIVVNYSNMPVFPPFRMSHSFQLNLPLLTKSVSCFSGLFSCIHNCLLKFEVTLSELARNNRWPELGASIDLRSSANLVFFVESLSYLQFIYCENVILPVEGFPANDIKSLSLLLDFEKPHCLTKVMTDHLNSLKWPKLKNFSVQEYSKLELGSEMEGQEKEASSLGSTLLSLIIPNAPNITALNFCGIHIGHDLPVEAISCLKCLDVIAMPTCGIQREATASCLRLAEREFPFLEVINGCTEVKHFILQKCILCSDGPREAELRYLRNWKQMMHLTLSDVPALRVCTFLRDVADSCHDLRALEITALGNENVCHYTPNLVYLLRTAKHLQLLRINQRAFRLQSTLLWNAIESASNLECLCIQSINNSYPAITDMLSAIKELKYLYIIHLFVQNMPQNFESRVRKILRGHQVKSPQICIDVSNRHTLSPTCAFYHFGYPCFHDIVQ